MNFFKEQQIARERLIKFRRLFYLTVFLTAYATAMVFDIYISLKLNENSFFILDHVEHPLFWGILGFVLIFIMGMSLLKRWQLRNGGQYIAEKAGGKQIPIGSNDIKHVRLKNIVEEMSIASGIIPPKIYVLEKENEINAFAAGFTINDAVIAVSSGCLEKLTRDELQGVVAHEIGHIVNGDMKLNLELIGYTFGLSCIAEVGRTLLRGSDDRKNRGHIIGFVIYLVGIVGYFMGLLLKQTISRGQEFAADAKAVQFTRNPDGIGGALKKIFVREKSFKSVAKNGDEISHLWLYWPSNQMLASHPPLEERLVKIFPRFDKSQFIQKEKKNLSLKMESDLTDEITKSFSSNESQINESTATKIYSNKLELENSAYEFFESISSHHPVAPSMDSKFIERMDLLLGNLRSLDQDSIVRILNKFKEIIASDKNITPREIICFILFKETLLAKKRMPSSMLGLTKAKDEIIVILTFLTQISNENSKDKLEHFKKGTNVLFGNSEITMSQNVKTQDLLKALEVCQNLVPLAKEKALLGFMMMIDRNKEPSFNLEVFKKVLAQMMGVPVNITMY